MTLLRLDNGKHVEAIGSFAHWDSTAKRVRRVIVEPGTSPAETAEAMLEVGTDPDAVACLLEGHTLTQKERESFTVKHRAAVVRRAEDVKKATLQHPGTGQFVADNEKDALQLGIWRLLGQTHPELRRQAANLYATGQPGASAEGPGTEPVNLHPGSSGLEQ